MSLGASRRRIIGQLLTEGLVLALLGAAAGAGVAAACLALFRNAVPSGMLPAWMRYTPDLRVFGVVAAACLGSIVVFGLAPALSVSRADFNSALKDGGRIGFRQRRARWRTGVFLTVQFALTIVMLANLVLGNRQVAEQRREELALDTTRVMTMWISPVGERYAGPGDRLAFFGRLTERLGGLAAVSSLSLASALPRGGAPTSQLEIEGRPAREDELPSVSLLIVGERYFATLAVPMLRGREFSALDGSAGHEHAIVNERLAQWLFPNEDPVGRRIRRRRPNGPADAPWLTIAGVAPNVPQRQVAQDDIVYVPLRQNPPSTVALILRAADAPASLTPLVREAVRSLDSDLPIYRALPLEQAIRDATWNLRLGGRLLATISIIALCFATLGLYAVTAYAVVQRRHEFGLRIAIGASTAHVVWLVLQGGLRQIAAGLAVGVVAAILWDRFIGLAGTSGAAGLAEPAALGTIGGVLALVTIAACVWPARRAVRLDGCQKCTDGWSIDVPSILSLYVCLLVRARVRNRDSSSQEVGRCAD